MINIYLTDKNETVELELVPECTNNTWDTEDEIQQWNNGREEAGFHYNEELGRWETTSTNYAWWKEIADGREAAYEIFEDYGECCGTVARNGYYDDFSGWFRANTSELEDEKEMVSRIPDFIEAIRAGEVEDMDKSAADEIEVDYQRKSDNHKEKKI